MIKYTKATVDDFPAIIALEKKCFNEFDRFSEKNILYQLKNSKSSIIFDIIKYDDKIVGYSSYLTRKNSSKIRLYSICVAPEYSGKHIASDYLEKRLTELAVKYDEIALEVRISNVKALHLYNTLGFRIKQLLPGYYTDGEDGYRLIKIF